MSATQVVRFVVAFAVAFSLTAGRADAGPLILAGHDPDDHGFTTQYKALFDALYANVTKSGSGILAIGADPGSTAGNWITTVAGLMAPPQTVTFVNGAAISTVSFAPYKILHIPSTTVDTPGGIHATNENPLLSARAADIAAFINSGGGLFGLTQDQVADAYDYLGPFADVQALGVPSSGVCASGQNYDNVTPTAEGSALGITASNIDGCCWHNVFTSFAPFLNVLATANEPGCTNINGIASVIGCLQCSLPGQMNLEPVLDLNPPGTQHTVTATFVEGQAPNDPVAGVLVTFEVISGPNVGATGTDTTDINGEATFTYTGTGGVGVDVIEATAQDPNTLETITSNQVKKFWDDDCQPNGIPDTCDLDCSGFAGACADWVGCGASDDANSNDVPDECDECVTNGDCDDDLFCNGAETCVAGDCVAGTPPDCNDGVSCTIDSCNETTNQCDHGVNNGACNDGLFCNGTETCHATLGCQAGTPPNCNDGVSCTTDACNEATDTCDYTPNNGACSNGLFCDGAETCHPTNGCQAGPPVDCGDGVSCTADACNEATDSCDHAPNDGACSNGLFCDGAETCHPTNGCQNGSPPNCNDGVSCTTDACNEALDACDHTASDSVCSNGLFCDGAETCHPTNGCQNGSPPNCNDGVSCTGDSCDEANDECDHVPSDAACDDGLFCNGDETCDPLEDCEPGTTPCGPMSCSETLDQCVMCTVDAQCDNGLFCDGQETCNAGTGTCDPGTPVVCNDGVACTVDACDENTDACAATPSDAACSDGAFCNGAETCHPVNGCLAGASPNCNDGVACTVDACNEAADQCDHTPNHGTCSNGLFCDGAEICHPTNDCIAGMPIACGDGVGCTADACNEAADQCDHTPVHGSCSNGAFCDGAEVCSPTLDCQPGPAVICNDGIACTSDACDEIGDQCAVTPNHTTCGNGLFCDGNEICDPLLGCQSGPAVDCDDMNACTADSCDETANQCVSDNICCGNGVIDPGEDCEPLSNEICNNLLDDDNDGLYDCADSDCGEITCSGECLEINACSCIENDPAVILLAKTPDYFKIHGRIRGDESTTDPQADGASIQLTNVLGVIYEAQMPPGAFIVRDYGRYRFKRHAAKDGISGICSGDPDLTCTTDAQCALSGAGTCVARGLFQLSLRYRFIENIAYLTFRVKAYGDLSLATESCMTTQFTTGDDAGSLRTDWKRKGERAWLLRINDYSCDEPGCDGEMSMP